MCNIPCLPISILQAEVEETLKRIQGQKGVQGIIIANAEGTIAACSLQCIIYLMPMVLRT